MAKSKVVLVSTPYQLDKSIYADLDELLSPLFDSVYIAYQKQYRVTITKSRQLSIKGISEALKNTKATEALRTKRSKGDKHRNRKYRWS